MRWSPDPDATPADEPRRPSLTALAERDAFRFIIEARWTSVVADVGRLFLDEHLLLDPGDTEPIAGVTAGGFTVIGFLDDVTFVADLVGDHHARQEARRRARLSRMRSMYRKRNR
jgi:hypothetical protein